MIEALSEYERRRLENIRKNQTVLAALAIPTLPTRVLPSTSHAHQKPHARRRKQEPTPAASEPKRSSARLRHKATGEAIDPSPIEEPASSKTPPDPKPKRVLGPIPFAPEDGASTEFTNLISAALVKPDPAIKYGHNHHIDGKYRIDGEYHIDHKDRIGHRDHTDQTHHVDNTFRIDGEFSIAKTVQERIYSMAVHPGTHKIIVSAGSKAGAFGIWDATDAWHGVATLRHTFHFQPHAAAISNQRYNPQNPAQLFMTSYDGVIRCLDITLGHFSELYHSEEEQYISGFDHNSDGSVLFFTDTDGVFSILDVRAAKKAQQVQLHQKKAGGLGVSPVDNNYFATSSLDDTIAVWDMRTLKPSDTQSIARFEYRRAVTSVYFHPRIRDAILSTSYDDAVRFHQHVLAGPNTPVDELRVSHNNQTGRWITPFRAIWDPKSTSVEHSSAIVGNMNRGLDVISMERGIVTNNHSELLTAQPAVNAVHPTLDLIVSGTAGGKCILWKRY